METDGKNTDPRKDTPATAEQAEVLQHQLLGQIYHGPIPPPEILKEYNQITPGAADRIISMAEQEIAHRHEMDHKIFEVEKEGLKAEAFDSRMGQVFGLIIGMATVFCGAYTAVHGAQWAGGFIGTSGVVGLVSVFVLGRKEYKNKDTSQ